MIGKQDQEPPDRAALSVFGTAWLTSEMTTAYKPEQARKIADPKDVLPESREPALVPLAMISMIVVRNRITGVDKDGEVYSGMGPANKADSTMNCRPRPTIHNVH